MSAATTLPAATTGSIRVTWPRVLRSEWTKLTSLRSTWVSVLVALVLGIGITAIGAGVTAAHWQSASVADRAGFNPISTGLNGVYLAQLALGVLGVLLVTSEYATGSIRVTLAAVPRRLPVLTSKLVVMLVVSAAAGFVIAFTGFEVAQALLSSQHIQTSLSAPAALRMVCGAALYLVVVSLLSVAIGALTRSTAGGLATWVGVFFVVPPIFFALPQSFSKHVAPYLPAEAGQALWTIPDQASMAPWTGFAVLCAWTATALVLAAWSLRTRDA